MRLPILDSLAWREFRGTPGHSGLNTTTHLAKIADTTGKLHDCYVKLLAPNRPSLLCEAIGWLLTQSIGVPSTTFGAIVLVPVSELLKTGMALPDPIGDWETCPAWCSEIVSGKSVRQVHKWAFWLARKNCLRSKDTRHIAALDVWADNRDRNYGNVIRSTDGGYVSIDHETLLHDLLWRPTGICFEPRSLLAEAEQHLSSEELKRFHVEMVAASNSHATGLLDADSDITDIISALYPAHAAQLKESIFAYLNERSQAGWLASQMGIIA